MRAFLPAALALAAGCTSDAPIDYLVEQGFQQGSLILRAQPIEHVLRDPGLDPTTRSRLELSRRIMGYAVLELGMKTGGNYKRFLRVDRPWVAKVVVAAPKNRLSPHLFRYPIFGGLPYKGFFREDAAEALAAQLEAQGFDVYVRGVEAYSTTGWLPDPLVSTMISSESRLTELLFHELTHANFYFKEMADFNEAFASWMGFRSALAFYAAERARGDWPASKIDALESELRRSHEFQLKFSHVVREIIAKGREAYAGSDPMGAREAYFEWIKKRLASDPIFAGVANRSWNNAYIVSLGTYYTMVPAIEAYAQRHNLGPKEFLKKVVVAGPAIVPQILAASESVTVER